MSYQTSSPATAPAVTALPMNLTSLIRIAVVLVSGYLIKAGKLQATDVQTILGIALLVAGIAWSLFKNTSIAQKLNAALISPAVTLLAKDGTALIGPKLAPLILFLVLAGPLFTLSACKTPAALIPATDTVIVAEGETSLDLAYNVAAKAYLNQLPTMTPSVKAQVKPLLVKAGGLVQAADAAEVLGNETSMAGQISDALSIIGQAKSLLGVP